MNVVYTCDDRFAWLSGVSICSLLKHNSNVKVYLLGWKLSADSKKKLMLTANRGGGKIKIIDIQEDYFCSKWETSRWPAVALVRLFLDEFLPENIKRVLYLDCDTIILDDLAALWNQDMAGNVYCGVRDCINWRYKRNIGLSKDSLYINGGVMLVDMEKLRAEDVKNRSIIWLNEYSIIANYYDQDLINGIFQGKIGVLDARYNLMTIVAAWDYKEMCLLRKPEGYYSSVEIEKAKEHPAIIHYTTNLWIIRPWFRYSDHPWRKEFDKYLVLSPWCSTKKGKFPENLFVRGMKFFKRVPKCVSLMIIGYMHSFVQPNYLKIRKNFKSGQERMLLDH